MMFISSAVAPRVIVVPDPTLTALENGVTPIGSSVTFSPRPVSGVVCAVPALFCVRIIVTVWNEFEVAGKLEILIELTSPA